jgi:general secretion pathway protein K
VIGRATVRIGHGRGIALVLVLWVIALLTVMALGLTAAQRTESTLTANALDGARFRAAADAGIAYAVLHLLAPPALDLHAASATDAEGQPQEWLPDGSARPWTFAEVPLAISVSNEASRIDLNRADANVLKALLMVLGVPEDKAAALADRILDWRDEDDLVGLNGAEDSNYAAEGLPYGAKDGPFTSVEELRQVLGVTPDLYARLAPELTVDSGTEQVEQQFASAAVLAALQGVPLADAQATVAERTQSQVPGGVPGHTSAASGRGGPVYRIRVARAAAATADPSAAPAQPAGGAGTAPVGASGLAMEALVRIEQGGKPPVQIIWRRYGLAPPPPPPPPETSRGLWR